MFYLGFRLANFIKYFLDNFKSQVRICALFFEKYNIKTYRKEISRDKPEIFKIRMCI